MDELLNNIEKERKEPEVREDKEWKERMTKSDEKKGSLMNF